MGSIEGLVKKAKKAFRRHSESSGPKRVKVSWEFMHCASMATCQLMRIFVIGMTQQGIYDVSTTSSTKTSSEVLQEVERVLKSMNVDYKRKGWGYITVGRSYVGCTCKCFSNSYIAPNNYIHATYSPSYTLRCHVPSSKKDAKAAKMVVFNLEVCLITMGTLNLIGMNHLLL